MNKAEQLDFITIEEFEIMSKDEHLNYELINGVVMMSPSPSKEHQWIAGTLIQQFRNNAQSIGCKPYHELDFKANGDVYKPDVMLFCEGHDPDIPTIVFEILSPSNRSTDLLLKAYKYELAGVKEYWIIDPKNLIIIVHDYVNQDIRSYSFGETISSRAIQMTLLVDDIFS